MTGKETRGFDGMKVKVKVSPCVSVSFFVIVCVGYCNEKEAKRASFSVL